MKKDDHIITGAGPAGCVLANRLTEEQDVTVLLVEAGGCDTHPLFRMPAGFARMTKGIAGWGWSTVPPKHMSDRDPMAVVSAELKVNGLQGLRACGLSVTPPIHTSSNNAPTIMIGEKASDLVRDLPALAPAIFEHDRNERGRRAR